MSGAISPLIAGDGMPTPTSELPYGRRGIRGYYPVQERGKRAADGSVLDRPVGEYIIAHAFFDPTCELLRSIRPPVARMVPEPWLRCPRHGFPKLPAVDPFPVQGEEWRLAEDRAWKHLGPRAGVPSRYLSVSFESCLETPALAAARTYADGDDYMGCGLSLEGGVGCGKTTALRSLYRQRLVNKARFESDDKIQWFDFPDLTRLLLDPERRRETLNACLEADELLLDDVGASHVPKGFVPSIFEEIVIHREARDWPMVMTTNLSPAAFRRMFGDRVHDRLRGEWGRWLNVHGPSLRQKQRART